MRYRATVQSHRTPSLRAIAGALLVVLAVVLVAHFGLMAVIPTSSCHVGGEPVMCVVADTVGELILTSPIVLLVAMVVYMAANLGDSALRTRVTIALRNTALASVAIRAPAARALATRTAQRLEAPYSCSMRTGIGA